MRGLIRSISLGSKTGYYDKLLSTGPYLQNAEKTRHQSPILKNSEFNVNRMRRVDLPLEIIDIIKLQHNLHCTKKIIMLSRHQIKDITLHYKILIH